MVSAASTLGWIEWRRYENRQGVQAAIRSAKYGRFSDAEPTLRQALERDSGNVELLKPLALGLINSHKLNEADAILTQWFKPGDEQERYKELALADGQRAITVTPGDEDTAQKVVWLCLATGRFEEANRICRSHFERRPDDPELLHLQARVCLSPARFDRGNA